MKLVVATLAALAALFGSVEEGRACTRVIPLTPLEPRAVVANADAAFVGTLVDVQRLYPLPTPVPPGPVLVSSTDPHVFTFLVEDRLKGDLPERVEVISAASTASCGLPAQLGARVGLVLRLRNGAWGASLFDQYDPDFLRRGVLPLPEPTGTGEPVLLAGGGFGEARMATLDERGRVVEYGWGRGSVTSLSVCPGGKNAAELLTRDGQVLLAVRRLPGLQLVSESVVAEMGSGSSVACTASNGSEALAVVASYEQKPEARLLKVTPIGTATLERAAQLSLAVRGKTFFVSLPNGNLVAREGEGARRLIVRAGRHLTGMSVSPDMGFVAGLIGQEIVVADIVRRRTRTLPGISPFGATQWLDTRTLAVASGYGRNGWLELFDPEGRSLRGPLPWGAHATTFRGREAFGVDWAGRLLYTGSSGEPAVRGLLFSPAISTLAALPSP